MADLDSIDRIEQDNDTRESEKPTDAAMVSVLHSVGTDGSHIDHSIAQIQINTWFMYDNIITQDGLGLTFKDVDENAVVTGAWTFEKLSSALGINNKREILIAMGNPAESGFNDSRYDNPLAEIIARVEGKFKRLRTESQTMKAILD